MSIQEDPSFFKQWCARELSKILNSSVEDAFLDYLLSIEGEKDMREYLHDLVGDSTKQAQTFMEEFFRHWKPLSQGLSPTSSHDSSEQTVMQAEARPERDHLQKTSETQSEGPPPGFKSKQPSASDHMRVQSSHGAKKKPVSKFVPLMSQEGQSRVAAHIPGRQSCQCLAQKHQLINNCVQCGRIVCSQEGSGPCLFCGAIVCTPEEEEWLLKDSKKGKKFKEQFLKKFNLVDVGRPLDHIQGSESTPSLHKAQLHKDKLLEFDQTSASRTRVIDDESDYFSVDANRWLSVGDKEALRTKEEALREEKYGSRRNKAFTLDIAGRKVVEEKKLVDLYDEKHAKDALRKGAGAVTEEVIETHAGVLYNPAMVGSRPEFVESGKKVRKKREVGADPAADGAKKKPVFRLQDKALQEMRDDGACLSMHQPWATLLIAGIKRHEGRSWYTPHRGRLWIAATSKEPSTGEIAKMKEFYNRIYGEENLYFPSEYPTSCLLGCVDVVDCLLQEDYSEKYPGGESESDYVFIVENPQELVVKLPIKGRPKIWHLGKDNHLQAKRGLRTLMS